MKKISYRVAQKERLLILKKYYNLIRKTSKSYTYFLNLIYFNTTRPGISHTHLINLFQLFYIYILKKG